MVLLLPSHRKRRHCLRQVVDAVRYICRTGCQWRSLPPCFPPWSAVYYFRRWQPPKRKALPNMLQGYITML